MLPASHLRPLLCALLFAASLWISSCAVPLGPGYTIESQEIRVQFEPAPNSTIHVDSIYKLRNTGTRPLSSLELRLPGRLSFHTGSSQAKWDGADLQENISAGNSRNTILPLPQSWKVSENHTLHLSVDFLAAAAGSSNLSFASDAFFLPSEGWTPELLPANALFGTGGVPPKQWRLSIRVPDGFLVHLSGAQTKSSRTGHDITVQAIEHPGVRYPFVVAGRYKETLLDSSGGSKLFLWTRAQEDAAQLHQSADALARAIQAYDSTFGARSKNSQPFWIVECPVLPGCFSATQSIYANLLNENPTAVSSGLASLDTLMMDFSGSVPKISAAAPALAASWLGYGQNPSFYGQLLPLAALPAFASALGQEAMDGPSSRTETIRRALRMIPKSAARRKTEDESVLRAKSFLFFFALQERYGPDVFRKAISHMLSARQGHGFDLDDLIAAFEQETNQNVAEFVRLWMKRPGVPDDFRARYENASASIAITSKETMQ